MTHGSTQALCDERAGALGGGGPRALERSALPGIGGLHTQSSDPKGSPDVVGGEAGGYLAYARKDGVPRG